MDATANAGRRTQSLLHQQTKLGLVTSQVGEKAIHQIAHPACRISNDELSPPLTHGIAQAKAGLIHQRLTEAIHIREVVIQRGGGQLRLTCHLTQAQAVQTAPTDQQLHCRIKDLLPGQGLAFGSAKGHGPLH